MQTERDAEIVDWIARLGAAGAEHVMARFEMGESRCYERLRALTRDRLLERHTLLHRRPGLYVATRAGLRWVGLQRLGVFRLSPATFEHAWELARVAAVLEPALPGMRMLGERELRVIESDNSQLIASVEVGELHGRPALHRPDLALFTRSGRAVAVEVELSPKAPKRLETICRAYARARHLHRVYYLAPPGPVVRALWRAVAATRAEDRIVVLALDDAQGLIARELEVLANALH